MTATRPRNRPLPDVLGMDEIAELLGVGRRTPYVWRERAAAKRGAGGDSPDLFPVEDATVCRVPIWRRSVIVEWAQRTGRLAAPVEGTP